MANKRKIKKSIQSFDKRIEEHQRKIGTYEGKNNTLIEYLEKEINEFERQKQEKKEKLKK